MVTPVVVSYEFAFPSDETHGLGRGVPVINGYVHELRCHFGGYVRSAELLLHVAFSDPVDDALAFNVLGREGLHRRRDRGFFSQVQFGYRHHIPGRPSEVYLTFLP